MITVYEVPAAKWQKIGIIPPEQKVLDNCAIVGSGSYQNALEELIGNLNDDVVDTDNCYLYIEENIEK